MLPSVPAPGAPTVKTTAEQEADFKAQTDLVGGGGGDESGSHRTITIKRKKGEGIGLQLRDEGADGTVIAGLVPGSVAADAGAIPGDTIVALDGRSVVGLSHAALVAILKKTGTTFTMTTDPPKFV